MKSRLRIVLLALLLSLFGFAVAFEKDDHEIFRLRDEVIQAEGVNVTFYSFLNVSESASRDGIERAYRIKSKRLHPDKAINEEIAKRSAPKAKTADKNKKPGVRVTKGPSQKERAQIAKEANERYARLTTVANVLRGPGRDRYDHFLRNGFPMWRGTGYYYSRFRPGLGAVLIGLMVFFGGGMHYGAMYVSWKRQREFVQRYVTHARKMAWGDGLEIPGVPGLDNITGTATPPPAETDSFTPLNRRQKRMQEKENKKKETKGSVKTARANGISRPVDKENISGPQGVNGPQGSKKKVHAENGKILIVDSVGNVFLEQDTEEGERHEFLLDPDEIPMPTIFQTALFRVPIFLYSQTVGRAIDMASGKSGDAAQEPLLDESGAELSMGISPDNNEDGVLQSATSINANSEARKRKLKAKGKR